MSTQEPIARVVLRPRAHGTTLYRWLYEEIRTAILDSRLSPGAKLPARKALARQYRVSVRTIVAATGKLVSLGYLETRAGRGTYVSAALPDGSPDGITQPPPRTARAPRRGLSARGRLLAAQPFPKLSSSHSAATFRIDHPAADIFPLETWSRLATRHLRRGSGSPLLAHGQPLGFPPLRAALADYVSRTRGVLCEADQVVITSGTQHSLDLVARLLLDPGDPVWMEDPGYAPATSLLRSHGAKVVPVPVDAQGIDCNAGRAKCPLARLAYVTPGCQFPLGMPMSRERRLKLLQWAEDAGAWVFEDDYGGLLQCDSRSAEALHGADRVRSVIYSNSFNRMLFPSLRLGFLVLPPAFIEPAAAALSITQRYQPVTEQAVLADFITQGHLDRHAQRLHELYRERREALIAAGRMELGGLMHFSESQAGWQVVGWLPASVNETEAWRRAAARQIDSVTLSSLTIDRQMPPGLVFGVGAADPRTIRTAIARLGRVLRVLAWQTGVTAVFREKAAPRGGDQIPREPRPAAQRPGPVAKGPALPHRRSVGFPALPSEQP